MKIGKKIVLAMLSMLALLQAVVTTVSAKALGEGVTILGFNAGWVLIIIGVVITVLFAVGLKIPTKSALSIKHVGAIVAGLLIIGVAMVAVQTPAVPVADITGMSEVTFLVEATAVTTAGSYYPDTTYDEGAKLFTVPYKCNTTSDLLFEHGDNSSYGDDPRINFTCRADPPDDVDDNDLAYIYYKVTNPTLYTQSDSDNYVLVKTDDKHQASWTDQDGITTTVSGWTSGGIEEALTVDLDLELFETGLAQADIFDPCVLRIELSNKAGTWTDTYTVQFILTESWTGDV